MEKPQSARGHGLPRLQEPKNYGGGVGQRHRRQGGGNSV
jgi:hypothetical protein